MNDWCAHDWTQQPNRKSTPDDYLKPEQDVGMEICSKCKAVRHEYPSGGQIYSITPAT